MKVYILKAYYGEYDDKYDLTIGVYSTNEQALVEKEFFENNIKQLKELYTKQKEIVDYNYETMTEEEFEEYYKDIDPWKYISTLYDIDQFRFSKIEEFEIDKRLIDISNKLM